MIDYQLDSLVLDSDDYEKKLHKGDHQSHDVLGVSRYEKFIIMNKKGVLNLKLSINRILGDSHKIKYFNEIL